MRRFVRIAGVACLITLGSVGISACGITEVSVSTIGGPAGCTMKADNPHQSSHNPATINAEVTIKCTRETVVWMTVSAQMWDSRWWGYNQVGTPGHKTVYDARYVTVNAYTTCEDNSMRVTGTGAYTVGPGGLWIAAETVINTKTVSC